MSKLTPLQATAPRKIFLQIDDHEGGHDEPFPDDTEGVTWWAEPAQACEVAYVREDLAAAPAGGAEPVAEKAPFAVREAFELVACRQTSTQNDEALGIVRAYLNNFPAPTAARYAESRPTPEQVADAMECAFSAIGEWPQGDAEVIEAWLTYGPAVLAAAPSQPQPQPERYVSALDPALQAINASAARMDVGIEKLRTDDVSDLDPELLALAEQVIGAQPEAPAEPSDEVLNAVQALIEAHGDTRIDFSGWCQRLSLRIEDLKEALATPAPAAQQPTPEPHPKSVLATRCETALDSLEAMLGGRNGPSIQLRAWVRELSTVDGGPPTAVAQQPAVLTDAEIDALAVNWADAPAAVRQLGDGRTAEFWSISRQRLYCLIRSAIKAQGGSQ